MPWMATFGRRIDAVPPRTLKSRARVTCDVCGAHWDWNAAAEAHWVCSLRPYTYRCRDCYVRPARRISRAWYDEKVAFGHAGTNAAGDPCIVTHDEKNKLTIEVVEIVEKE